MFSMLSPKAKADTGLVGYWKFDEGSGSIAHDSSGNGNDGTVNGASWTTGISNGALQFDGIDDYVGISSSPSLALSGNQISLEMWIRPTVTLNSSNTSWIIIMDKGDGYGFEMFPNSATFEFFVNIGDADQWLCTTTNNWIAGTWYHIAGTYNSTTESIYVNGILENTKPLTGFLSGYGLPLSIGSYCFGTQCFFNGAIDEVKIYNRALSATEIRNEYISTSVDWWPMFHHDPEHTGYSMSPAPTTNQTLWKYATSGTWDSSPVVADGVLYTGGDGASNCGVYALNSTTGALIWNYSTAGNGIVCSPAVANGVVYVGTGGTTGTFYALNATTGSVVWKYTPGGPYCFECSPVISNGIVYVGTCSSVGAPQCYLYALSASSGSLIWNFPVPYGDYMCSPAVANGIVYIGQFGCDAPPSGYDFFALSAATGGLIWEFRDRTDVSQWGTGISSSPAVANGIVYVGSCNGMMYALNAASGTQVWNYTCGGQVWSSPAVANGIVYVGSTNGNVYALNVATGALVWKYTTGRAVAFSSPAIASGVVYVGSEDDNVYALNIATGALVWKYTTGNGVWSSPAVVNGVVYVGSEDGKVYAFGGPIASPPLVLMCNVSLKAETGGSIGYSYSGASGTVPSGQSTNIQVPSGTHISLTANSDSQHSLSTWSTVGWAWISNSTSTQTTLMITGDCVVTGYFVSNIGVSLTPVSKTIQIGQSVQFTASASGGSGTYVDYIWCWNQSGTTNHGSFDSGSSNTYGFDPASAGTYSVYVTVSDSNGNSYPSVSASVTVQASKISPSAIASQTSGYVPLQVQFNGSASGGSPPYSYSWSFGDGSPISNQQNPSHSYSSIGTFTAVLTVTDSAGSFASSSVAITVSRPVSYSVTVSAGGGGMVYYSYYGGSSTVLSSSSTSLSAGSGSSLNLTAYSNEGYSFEGWATSGSISISSASSSTATAVINGNGQITANFVANPLSLSITESPFSQGETVPFQVTFTARPTGGTGSYSISWVVITSAIGGFEPYGTGNTFTYTFKYAGSYIVQATATCPGTSETQTATCPVTATGGSYLGTLALTSGSLSGWPNSGNPVITLANDGMPNQCALSISSSGVCLETGVKVYFGEVQLPNWLSNMLGFSSPWYSIEITNLQGASVYAPCAIQEGLDDFTSISVTLPQGTPTTVNGLRMEDLTFTASPTSPQAMAYDIVAIFFAALGLTVPLTLLETAANYFLQQSLYSLLDIYSMSYSQLTQYFSDSFNFLKNYFLGAGLNVVYTALAYMSGLQLLTALASYVYDGVTLLSAIIKGDVSDTYAIQQVYPMTTFSCDPTVLVNALIRTAQGEVGYLNGTWENTGNLTGLFYTGIMNNTYGFAIPVIDYNCSMNLTVTSPNGETVPYAIAISFENETNILNATIQGSEQDSFPVAISGTSLAVALENGVALTNVELSKNTVVEGGDVNVNVILKNEGNATVVYNVTVYGSQYGYGTAWPIYTFTNVTLAPGRTVTLTYEDGFTMGIYTLSARVYNAYVSNTYTGVTILVAPIARAHRPTPV
jgi:outer membrane protein assembly factor BamB